MEHNAVKSPLHYTEGRKFEPKDVIRDWGLNFNLGSALKYIARAGRKADIVEDLKKAAEYISFEIAALEAEGGKAPQAKAENEPVAVRCGVIEMEVPPDMPLEAILQMVAEKVEEAERL